MSGKLNPNARTFNPNAKAFVPSFGKPAAAPASSPAPAPVASASSSAAAPKAPAASVAPAKPAAVTVVAAPVATPSPPPESWENDAAVASPPGGPEVKEEITSISQLAIEEKLPVESPAPVAVPVTKLDLDTPPSKPIVIDDDDPELKAMIAEEEEFDNQKAAKPKVKKGTEEFKVHDNREHLNVVFVGHVDAGKSTMSGQILLLTGQVDERTIQKYEREAKEKNRESWYLAYIMDTNEEERAKGKTVEVGRAHFATTNKRYTLLDAPGHKNYVPNMIGGAAQADVAILIISARKGEFETGFERGGQTREHALLVKTLGVSHLVVAVNKMDDPTVQWSKERYDKICNDLTPFLKKCNYKPKEITFVPCSGFTGANVREAVTEAVCPWLNPRKSLLTILDELPAVPRDENGPLRVPVVARYRDMGVVVVLGKVECGTLSKGMKLMLAPTGKELICDGIDVDDTEVNLAKPGENVNIKVKGCEEEEIQTGFVIGDIKRPPALAMMMEAQLLVLDLLEHKPILTAGYLCILHVHTAIVECQVVDLISQMDPKTGQKMKRKPAFAKSGAVIIAKLAVEQTVACEKYKDVAQLGRFSLRDEGKTIAIGKFLQLSAVSTVKKEEFESKE